MTEPLEIEPESYVPMGSPSTVDMFGEEPVDALSTERLVRALSIIATSGWTYDRAADDRLVERGLVEKSTTLDPPMFSISPNGTKLLAEICAYFDKSLSEMIKSGAAMPVFEQSMLFEATQ